MPSVSSTLPARPSSTLPSQTIGTDLPNSWPACAGSRLPGETPIAIERPSGLLVDVLIEAEFVVTPVHPNVVKACRPQYRALAAKSDPGDAYILATSCVRTATGWRRSGHLSTPSRRCNLAEIFHRPGASALRHRDRNPLL